MTILLAVTLGYGFGSVPFAYLATRGQGLDLRQIGSGNVGAANVLRTSGVPPAIVVMVLDAVKGSAAVIAAQQMTQGTTAPVVAGLAAIVGHVYPVWLGFRGGKGVATTAGVFAVLAPIASALAASVFIITIWITRFVSAGSLAAALALVLAAPLAHASGAIVAGALCAAVIVVSRHRANVARLAAGTERRLGLRLFERR
jgi:glycerol-3-phosphate acyltransferase PlsY